jgi:hypothetical protein
MESPLNNITRANSLDLKGNYKAADKLDQALIKFAQSSSFGVGGYTMDLNNIGGSLNTYLGNKAGRLNYGLNPYQGDYIDPTGNTPKTPDEFYYTAQDPRTLATMDADTRQRVLDLQNRKILQQGTRSLAGFPEFRKAKFLYDLATTSNDPTKMQEFYNELATLIKASGTNIQTILPALGINPSQMTQIQTELSKIP